MLPSQFKKKDIADTFETLYRPFPSHSPRFRQQVNTTLNFALTITLLSSRLAPSSAAIRKFFYLKEIIRKAPI